MSISSKSAEQAAPSDALTGTQRPWISAVIDDSASAWQVSRAWIIAILIAPAVIAASGVAAAFAGKSIYKLYTEEDGIAEYLQAGLYAACFFMSLAIVRHHVRCRKRLLAGLYVFLTIGLFFMVGEELSWGQRIFGWQTPEVLTSANKQDETNLHNIHGVGSTFKWVQGLVGAYGGLLPLVFLNRNRLARFRDIVDAVVPHYLLIGFFLPMFVWRLYRNLWGDPSRFYYVITNYNEVIELILACGFFLFLLFQLRECRRGSPNPVKA